MTSLAEKINACRVYARRCGELLHAALSGRTYDYTSGSIRRAVFLLAIPMMLEMGMESIFAICDIFFVAGLGAEAVAAVGLTEAVITLLYAVAVGLSISVTALVARRIGEKNPEAAAIVAGQTIWIGVFFSLAVGLTGGLYGADILRLMGAGASVIELGSGYTSIMLSGAFTVLFLFLCNGVFRGAGNAVIAMRALILANGINIALDPCLIYGIGPFPELGVTGAAIATNIGRGVGVLYQFYHLLTGATRVKLLPRHLRIVPAVMLRLLRVSAGGMAQFLIATASWVILMRLVAPYGSAAVAGYTIAIRIIDLTLLPAWGLSNAAGTLVGQNLGAGRPERAEQSVWQVARYNVLFLLGVAILFISGAESIVAVFSADPVVIRYGGDCLRYISYGYGLFALSMALIQAFNGAGDTGTPTIINFICFWLVQIPLAWVLAETFAAGPQGIFIAITVAESLLAVLAYLQFRAGRWKLRQI